MIDCSRGAARHCRRFVTSAAAALMGIGAVWLAGPVVAAEGSEPTLAAKATIDFSRDVFPLLRRSCFECHADRKQEGSLRLDQRQLLFDSETVIPGKATDSELIRRIELPESDPERMPAIGKSLSASEVALLRAWIDQGAVWPDTVESIQHWAYIAPRPPVIPAVSDESWVKNEIDRFVLRRLELENLTPSTQAKPEVLIRRLYLDLIGLPPSVEESTAFVDDPSDAAYADIVDDLLARPQFGERWARHWLDLARYADSHGFQRDDLRDNWAYRDWVIRAFNDDMPFDQFTIEQLAGDLLPDASESQRIATGFHRCSPTNVEAGSIPEETRIAQVIDRVNTTATVWLGSTLECAQCHDHKFDPFTTKEYYQLLAFFNNTALEADRANPKMASSIRFIGPTMPISDPARDAERAAKKAQLQLLQDRRQARRRSLAADLGSWAGAIGRQIADAPQTHVLEVTDFESNGNTDTFQKLEDGSVLLVGTDPPAKDSYVLRTRLKNLTDVRALRIDALTDPSLPGQGPGRGDAQRSNFVLNDFAATLIADGAERTPLHFASATADFSQRGFDVARAIDDDPKTAWAIGPQFGKPHWATFVLERPLVATDGSVIEFRLDQSFGQARTIGRLRISAITGDVAASPIPARVHELVSLPVEQWTREDRELMVDFRASTDEASQAIEQDIAAAERSVSQISADETLVMVEMSTPRMSSVFVRGDYKSPGESVQPGTPEVLHPFSRHSEPGRVANRLTLAQWLVDPANPLTARVTVNRWWAELFGAGIVETLEDFGIKGESPSHPELLDFLAVDFQRHRSMKRVIRQIVMSATYRQSSTASEDRLATDDRNRLLSRGPRFRMDAEMIRDNALAIAGLLNLRQSGPPIRPFQPDGIWTKVGGVAYDYEPSPGGEQHRRGIYVVIKRGAPYPSFINFDSSNRLTCSVKRSRTNTPLQALTLLNDPVYVTAAKSLAAQAASDDQRPASQVIGDLFRRCVARSPSEAELGSLVKLFEAQRLAAGTRRAEAIKLLQESDVEHAVSPEDFSAWYSLASVLLNLHETITKP